MSRMTSTQSDVHVGPLQPPKLPSGIRSRFLDDVNGLRMHILEAGFETTGRPCVLLLHGFPELAFSWRKIMIPLAEAGYHVVAPDQRGYGRTSGWDSDYDGDLTQFRMTNIVRDALALVSSLGHQSVHAVVGHDFGSFAAGYCAMIRPDVFRSVAFMSAPFGGPPATSTRKDHGAGPDMHADLAALDPPRKHYQWYYGTRPANRDMLECEQGLHAFLRAYFHVKSGDWPGNRPFPLGGWTADELAKLPRYYIMDLDRNMAETVAPDMPDDEAVATCDWLSEGDLQVYTEEFQRTGFQGGLHWYRCMTDVDHARELQLFSGRTIDVPACYVAGRRDWGIYQKPGAFEAMQATICSDFVGCELVDGAGHWVQQENSETVARFLKQFLETDHR